MSDQTLILSINNGDGSLTQLMWRVQNDGDRLISDVIRETMGEPDLTQFVPADVVQTATSLHDRCATL